jgi:hypothetical protein
MNPAQLASQFPAAPGAMPWGRIGFPISKLGIDLRALHGSFAAEISADPPARYPAHDEDDDFESEPWTPPPEEEPVEDDWEGPAVRVRTTGHEVGHLLFAASAWGIEAARRVSVDPSSTHEGADGTSWTAAPTDATKAERLALLAAGAAGERWAVQAFGLRSYYSAHWSDLPSDGVEDDLRQAGKLLGYDIRASDDLWLTAVAAATEELEEQPNAMKALFDLVHRERVVGAAKLQSVLRQNLWT